MEIINSNIEFNELVSVFKEIEVKAFNTVVNILNSKNSFAKNINLNNCIINANCNEETFWVFSSENLSANHTTFNITKGTSNGIAIDIKPSGKLLLKDVEYNSEMMIFDLYGKSNVEFILDNITGMTNIMKSSGGATSNNITLKNIYSKDIDYTLNGTSNSIFLLDNFVCKSFSSNSTSTVKIGKLGGILNGFPKKEFLYDDYNSTIASDEIMRLNTSYMATKMQQEGVYDDFVDYMDSKIAYDKQQEKFDKDKQLAYEEELKQNPELTYEEFLQNHSEHNLSTYSRRNRRSLMIENVEPQPSEALKRFMEKWL